MAKRALQSQMKTWIELTCNLNFLFLCFFLCFLSLHNWQLSCRPVRLKKQNCHKFTTQVSKATGRYQRAYSIILFVTYCHAFVP
jgi:hypothetical protein